MSQSTKAEAAAKIRACLARPGLNAVAIAGLAGCHPNTLRDYESDEWNPKIETLDRIIRVVEGIERLAQ